MSARAIRLNASMNHTAGQNGSWFGAVVERYEAALVRYAARITGNVDRARDVVQDAFLRLHQQNGSPPDNVQAWLYTVCRRRALDIVRKETRMKTLEFSSVENGQAAVCETPPSQAAAMERQETESAILQLLAELPGNQQEVVRLKFQENLSYRDISEITGLSVSNVGYLLHVALKTLRQQLAPAGN